MKVGKLTRRALFAGAVAGGGALIIRGNTLAAEHETISVLGQKIHFVRAGKGPPLVLLHGASSSLRDWTFSHLERLAQNWTVIAFDRPGYGGSEPASDPSLKTQALVMRRALASLGYGRVTIAGHSFGGAVALAWAVHEPQSVTGLILTGTPSHVWPGTPGRLYDITNTPVVGWAFSEALPLFVPTSRIETAIRGAFAPQEVPNGYFDHINPRRAVFPPSYRRNAAQVGILKEQLREMTPLYQDLTVPVEIIHGEADTTVSPTIHSGPLNNAIPNSQLHLLPGVGHMPHHTNPDVFYRSVERFISA